MRLKNDQAIGPLGKIATIRRTSLTAAAGDAVGNRVEWQSEPEAVMFLDTMTVDGRMMASEGFSYRPCPQPLMFMDGDSHGGMVNALSVNVGQVDGYKVDGTKVYAWGSFNETPEAERAIQAIESKDIYRVSVDPSWRKVECHINTGGEDELAWLFGGDDVEETEDEIVITYAVDDEWYKFIEYEVMGLTIVPFSAFPDAQIGLKQPTSSTDQTSQASIVVTDEMATLLSANGYATAAGDTIYVAGEFIRTGDSMSVRTPSTALADDSTTGDGESDDSNGDTGDGDTEDATEEKTDDKTVADINAAVDELVAEYKDKNIDGSICVTIDEVATDHPFADADASTEDAEEENADSKVLTASAAHMVPVDPPQDWFDYPEDVLTGDPEVSINVDDDGRVYGYVALAGQCHIGIQDRCVLMPESKTDHRFFHSGSVKCDDGTIVRCGQITLGTTHADRNLLDANKVMEHYENTGMAAADVRLYRDDFGIAMAGALRPSCDAEKCRELRGAKVSGDWRPVNGKTELVGLLAVNVPGFPVPEPVATITASGADLKQYQGVWDPTEDQSHDRRPELLLARSKMQRGSTIESLHSIINRKKNGAAA